MTKKSMAVFPSREAASSAVQDLLGASIARQQDISVVAGDAAGAGERAREAGGAAAVSGGLALLTGLTTLAIPGVGIALVGVPGALALEAAASGDDERDEMQRVLRQIGLTEAESHGYADEIRRGYTLVTADIADEQSDAVAAVFHQHACARLAFRRLAAG